jgi:high affinity sulfate transporter 1
MQRPLLPGVSIARSYRHAWLRPDIQAGIVLTALLIPAGMGYAEAAGLPAVTGLYATIVPLLVYAVVGPSRVLVLGPDSSLAPIIASSILPLAAGDPDRAVALAGLLAIMMGVILVVAGFLRLGFVTDLLSKPIRTGYLIGVAVVVIVNQIPKLLGFSVDATTLVGEIRATGSGVADGETQTAAAVLGIGSLVVIATFRGLRLRVPGALVAMVASMVAVGALGLDDEIDVVGRLPRGLPTPALDGLEWGDFRSLVGPALGIALIAFADTGVLSRTFAARHGRHVDGSQEMAAIGAANAAAGVFGGFPISASSSRTPTAEQAGAQTQLAAVVGALLIVVFMVVAPGLTEYLPSATLAAVVIVAASALIDIAGLSRLATMSRTEFGLAIAAFAGVALFGVLEGIATAVALSMVVFVYRAWRPYTAELVRVDEQKGYHDVDRHPEGRRIPGLVIARFDAPLFFANGGIFAEFVRDLVRAAPTDTRWVVIAAEPITGIDTTARDALIELDDDLAHNGVRLVFAEMKGPVKDHLGQLGLEGRFGLDRFFPTMGTAVSAYVAETGVDWVDWEKRRD